MEGLQVFRGVGYLGVDLGKAGLIFNFGSLLADEVTVDRTSVRG